MLDELNNEYFKWLLQLVSDKPNYRRLMRHLFYVDFRFTIPMDENRADEGVDLRYSFGRERNYGKQTIQTLLDCRPCSILEMMVALADRCEEHIMGDPELGDRTDVWFWSMIRSLGLSCMYDSRYDALYVDEVLERFLNHRYKRNGEGGLFTIKGNYRLDLRKEEIWQQLNYYIQAIMQ